MAWVQVGPHKINTALVCYVEQDGDTVRIYFHGEWEGNPLDLHFDEAKAFWRHLKAEDVMIARDKGSAAVLPKVKSTSGYSLDVAEDGSARPKPPTNNAPGASAPVPHSSRHDSHRHGHSPKH